MVKTIKEFRSEVRSIRKEIRKKGRKADKKLLASWMDRLLISLEGISPTLDLMQVEIEQLSKIGTTATKSKFAKKSKKVKVKAKKEKVKKEKKVKKKKKKGFFESLLSD